MWRNLDYLDLGMTRVFAIEDLGAQKDFICLYHNSHNHVYMRMIAHIRAGMVIRSEIETFGVVPIGEQTSEFKTFGAFCSRYIAGETCEELNDCCVKSLF